MKLMHWDETRDGQLSEAAMRAKLEVVGNEPVIALDAVRY